MARWALIIETDDELSPFTDPQEVADSLNYLLEDPDRDSEPTHVEPLFGRVIEIHRA